MANIKISDLSAASAAADANELEINEAGTSKKLTVAQVSSKVISDIDAADIAALGDYVVVGDSPAWTGAHGFGGATSLELPNGAAPTVNADGEIALDITVTDFSTGILKYYGGEEMAVVAMPVAQLTSPTDGDIVTYNGTNDEFELVAASVPDSPVKAWVNFNGTGTVAIRSSFNVSSITDNGTGSYTVNFTDDLADDDYAVIFTEGNSTAHYATSLRDSVKTVSEVRVGLLSYTRATWQDTANGSVVIVGN